MKTSYSEQVSKLAADVMTDIATALSKGTFKQEINFVECTVEVLKDDHSTIWVKWGKKYDCELFHLPLFAMATIADAILEA